MPLETIEELQARIDAIMLGEVGRDSLNLMMSVCPSETGSWDHPATQQTIGWKYATLGYRKIQELEQDDLFRSYVQHDLYRIITSKLIGPKVGIVRAMYFAKPATSGGVRIGTIPNRQLHAQL